MRAVWWRSTAAGASVLVLALGLAACCRRSAAVQQAPPDQGPAPTGTDASTASYPFPTSLPLKGPTPLAPQGSLGGYADATGYGADAEALGTLVHLEAWRHLGPLTAKGAWAGLGLKVGASGVGKSWIEGRLNQGAYVRGALFGAPDGKTWVVLATSERADAAAEAVCLTRASLGLVYPQRAGESRLVEPAKEYDKQTVFDPIDGAAEQYFRYHFVRFYRGEYAGSGVRVTADVYEQGSSADAFGVQSAFLGPTAIDIGQQGYLAEGQLVFRQGPYFCRLQGKRCQEALKQIGSALSEAIAVRGPLPDMVALLDGVKPRPLSVHFCHAVEDLTPLIYLSTSNVLGLDLETDCLVAKVPSGSDTPITLLVVRYPEAEQASKGLAGLLGVALPKVEPKAGLVVGEWQPGLWAGITTVQALPYGWVLGVFDARSAQKCRRLAAAVTERIQ